MNNINIAVGGDAVFASGSIVSQAAFPIRLSIFPPNNPYFLEFRFVDDEGPSKVRNFNEGQGHVVELQNFSKTVNTSLKSPLYVAKTNGKKLMLMLAAVPVGGNPHTWVLSYTIVEGAAA